jgi:hypothetical protein
VTTTADGTGNLGPGTLKIGMTATLIDVSCLTNNAKIEPNITAGDVKRMLCGTSKAAPDEIDWVITGNVDVDAGLSSGFFALTWKNIGVTVDFEFTPSTAVGTKVIGKLKLAPLALGADEYGAYLNSDFEFALVNFDPKTAVTYGGTVTGLEADDEADDEPVELVEYEAVP